MTDVFVTVGDLKKGLEDIPNDTLVYTGAYYYECREGTTKIPMKDKYPVLLNSKEFPQEEKQYLVPLNPRPGQTQRTMTRISDAVYPLMWYNGDVLFLDTYDGPSSFFKVVE